MSEDKIPAEMEWLFPEYDFATIDLYCLREVISLGRLLALVPQKYADRPSFLAIAVRALAYFEDAKQQPMPQMYVDVRWDDVRTYCQAAARKLSRRLSGLV